MSGCFATSLSRVDQFSNLLGDLPVALAGLVGRNLSCHRQKAIVVTGDVTLQERDYVSC